MAAPIDICDPVKQTPKKLHSLVDRCCFCGMSFLQVLITGSGSKHTQKQFKQKLRINEERLQNMKKVVKCLSLSDNDTAVCQKCYRKVESVIRQQQHVDGMKLELEEMRNRLQQDIITTHTEKRLLISPAQQQPFKVIKIPTNVTVKYPVQLSSFQVLVASNKQLASSSDTSDICQQQDKENKPSETSKTAKKSLVFNEKVPGHGEVEIKC